MESSGFPVALPRIFSTRGARRLARPCPEALALAWSALNEAAHGLVEGAKAMIHAPRLLGDLIGFDFCIGDGSDRAPK